MNGAAHSFYSLWDITQPELPPRSRLCHLAPIGARTPDVENLTSFTMRLAAAHCVETGDLFRQEIAPRLNCSDRLKSETEPLAFAFYPIRDTQTVNGVGPGVARWVSVLESLTCQSDLQLLTVFPWRNLLTRQLLMRKTRAWCPDCYADSKDQHQPIYEKLIWTLIPVSVCIRHQRLLEENCPFCGRSSPLLKFRSRPGCCFRCDRWLGSNDRAKPLGADQSGEDLIRQIEKARVVGEMLTLSADLFPSFSPRDFDILLNRYARQITAGNLAAFARFLGFGYQMLVGYRHGVNIRPTLDIFIRLIQRLELSVKDFLAGKESKIELPDRREFHFGHSTSIVRELIQAAVMDPACPSLSELTAQIGYKSEVNLRQSHPELCREISARHRQAKPKASKPYIKIQALREKLTATLQEIPAPPLSQIAASLGYKEQSRLRDRCPDLYYALMERRHTYLRERKESLEKTLKAALIEEPPPALKAITSRLGMSSPCAIFYHFPELARAIIDRTREYREGCLERAQLALESALTEVPPPSVPEVGRRMNIGTTKLYNHFPDLCRRVAVNYLAYRHQRSIVRKEEQRKSKMNRLI